jgi:secondary thiamine-phosphate synthase enzyme
MEIVRDAGAERGVATVFVPGATAAVTAMEFEPGGVQDLKTTLDRLIPPDAAYEHNRLNYDSNSHAHIRAAIVGPSESVPIDAGRLMLGTWQEIVLLDFDDRPRERTVLVSVLS